MKLQLDEKKLNAYINEAIKQEINEGLWDKLAKFAGGKAAKQAARATKKAAPVAQKSGDAFKNLGKSKGAFGFVHNSKRTGAARRALKGANSKRGAEFVTGNASKTMGGQKLEYVVKTMKDDKTGKKALVFLDKNGNKLTGDQLKLAKSNFKLRSQQYGDIRKMGNLNRGIALTAIAGGVSAAAALNSKNPDAPWNDVPEGDGGQTLENGGFDGTFPWDTTEPAWTPRKPKTTAPATTPAQSQEQQPVQPEQQPARPKVEPIAPVNANIPAPRVTGPQAPGLVKHETQPSIAQNAVRTMGQTTNQSTLGLNDRRATNKRTKQNAINAINQAKKDGAMTKDQARNDKKIVRNAEKSLRKS